MKTVSSAVAAFLKTSEGNSCVLALSPAIVGRAQAAATKLKCSSRFPTIQICQRRVLYDNLVRNLKANGLGDKSKLLLPRTISSARNRRHHSVKLG